MSRPRAAVALWLVACAVSGLVVVNGGFAGRFDAGDQELLDSMDQFAYYDLYQRGTCFLDQFQAADEYPESDCIGDDSGKLVLIVGDSFAAHLYTGLTEVVAGSGYRVAQATKASCSYLMPDAEIRPQCKEFREWVVADLIPRLQPDLIVYSELWRRPQVSSGLAGRVARAVDDFSTTDARVVVVGPTPGFLAPVPKSLVISGAAGAGEETWLRCLDDRSSWDALVSATSSSGAELIEMDEATRRAVAGDPGRLVCLAATRDGPLHWDLGHLTEPGSELYAGYLWERISR